MINALMLTIAITLPQDAHIPTITVSGDIVTIEGNFAWIANQPADSTFALVAGTPLISNDGSLSSSYDASEPMQWRLSPGVWEFTAMGYPDNYASPNRNVATLTATIEAPDRIAQLRDILSRLTISRAELQQFSPTRAEILSALSPGP